jgi:hypothetical protein
MLDILKKKLEENPSINCFMNNLSNNNHPNKWSDNFLYDFLPFDMEIHRIKRGKIYKSEPKNKGYKTNNYLDSKNKVIAAFSYIPNWEEPDSYIFVRDDSDFRFIYRFNIHKKIASIFLQTYQDNRLNCVYSLNENGNFTVASINTNSNIVINLQTGFSINNKENKSNSTIVIDFENQDDIKIVREDLGKQPYTVYLGINPYMENQYINPLRQM